jgi:hypothetical protein
VGPDGRTLLEATSTTFTEFVTLLFAVRLFGGAFRGGAVRGLCDNAGVVQDWCSQVSPSSARVQRVIRETLLETLKSSVYLCVEWIPSLDNVYADYLSRQGGAPAGDNTALAQRMLAEHRVQVPQEWLQQVWQVALADRAQG